MKFNYPFLKAILGIVSSATGQHHPINCDVSLTVLSFNGTTIMNEYTSSITTFSDNSKRGVKCCSMFVF